MFCPGPDSDAGTNLIDKTLNDLGLRLANLLLKHRSAAARMLKYLESLQEDFYRGGSRLLRVLDRNRPERSHPGFGYTSTAT